jgi:prevent-host-death family protein
MTRAGVAKVKARLSHYLKRVKAGQEVIITDRGLPVAKLVPLAGAQHDESERQQLIREGLLIPGTGRVRDELLVPPKGDPQWGKAVLDALLEERREGR